MKQGLIPRAASMLRIPVLLLYIVLSGSSAARVPELQLDFGFHTFFENSKDLPELQRYKETYGEDINLLIVIMRSKNVFTPENLQAIDGLTRFLARQPEVSDVTSLTDIKVIRSTEEELKVEQFIRKIPEDEKTLDELRREAVESRELSRFMISDDARTTAVVAEIEGHLRRQNRLIEAAERWIENDPGSGRRFYLGGVNVIQKEYEETATRGIISNGVLILGVMGIILLLQYRRLAGLFLPTICALASMLFVIALMAVTDEPVNTVNQLVPELMLIIGIADGIYILSRYFEERRKHVQTVALDETMRHMIVACFFTSLTTAVGFGSLYAADMYLIKRFGLYCAVGVMISYVNIIVLNASILSFMKGPAAPAGAAAAEKPGRDFTGAFLDWVNRTVLHRRRMIVAVSLVLFASAMALCFKIRMQHRLLSELDEENPVVRTNEMFEKELFGVLSFAVELDGPPGSMVEPDALKKIDRIVEAVGGVEGVRKTLSLTQTLKEFNMKWMGDERFYRLPETRALAVQYLDFLDPELKRRIVTEDYSETRVMIRARNLPSSWWYDMMEELTPMLERMFPHGSGIDWRYNGSSHLAAKTLHHLIQDLLTTMILSIVMITVLMTLLFRSIRIGLISMVPNLLPLSLTFGFMGLAGIELRPATAIIFAVSLGIAVNDTIHLMARFREEVKKQDAIEDAVTATIRSAGRPVVYTSVLLIFGYSVLLISDFIAVKHFSMLTSVTLIGALWADLLLTPILLLWAGRKLVRRPFRRGRTEQVVISW